MSEVRQLTLRYVISLVQVKFSIGTKSGPTYCSNLVYMKLLLLIGIIDSHSLNCNKLVKRLFYQSLITKIMTSLRQLITFLVSYSDTELLLISHILH